MVCQLQLIYDDLIINGSPQTPKYRFATKNDSASKTARPNIPIDYELADSKPSTTSVIRIEGDPFVFRKTG